MASEQSKLIIHTRETGSAAPQHKRRRMRIRTRLSFRERLLCNSCLACAVLLGILALSNVQQPWAQHAAEGIEQALTMKVDLDQPLGQLNFVRKLMPESAMVFFSQPQDHPLARPVDGEPSHRYSEAQPWIMFEAEAGTSVSSPAEGVVSAVSTLSDGSYGLLIDHGEGNESVIAGLAQLQVQQGDSVQRSFVLGTAAGSIYYEYRSSGNPCDPTQLMGL